MAKENVRVKKWNKYIHGFYKHLLHRVNKTAALSYNNRVGLHLQE